MAEKKEKRYVSDNAQLMAEWDWEKNIELDPTQLTLGSRKKVWWKCTQQHSWEMGIVQRTYGQKCPYCNSRKLLPGYNDLATKHPLLAKEWHPTKNGKLTASDVFPSTHQKVWWVGGCGHEWEASVASRSRGNSCPICGKSKHTSFQEQAILYYIGKQYDVINGYSDKTISEIDIFVPALKIGVEYNGLHWHKNRKTDVTKNQACTRKGITLFTIVETNQRANIYREKFEIFFDYKRTALDELIAFVLKECFNITNIEVDSEKDRFNIWENYILCKEKNCLSSVFPSLSKEWHPSKNGTITPEKLSYASNKKVWWLGRCGHEWEARIINRINGTGCPFCTGQKVLATFNDLQTLHPDIAKEWHPTKNGELTPSNVSPAAHKKVWWLGKCGHEWEASITNRVSRKSSCPFCSSNKVLHGYNDLMTTHPQLSNEWDCQLNSNISPANVSKGSNKKVWWKCSKCGHKWEATIHSRTAGRGCPECAKQKRKKKDS